ncbi:MAG TPA: multiprotein-bridging factor 1 family protein [Nitrososphaerales archaeon]|nr:multiprotein-bridging factor 1 family protein [Nitrososphaerales archaeon]HUK75120.1 multiprotein-bridging factor 1 family protein [Nitrososphaerales archaeon]
MKAACEVCGSPLRASPNRVEIDGAIMVVCDNCARLGKVVGPAFSPAPGRNRPSPIQGRGFRPINPVFQGPRPVEPDSDKEVDPDYNVIIRQAREKMGLSQEQLGKLLNEKPSLISMVESRKLKPDVPLARKFMHQLKINLLVSLSELEGGRPTGI